VDDVVCSHVMTIPPHAACWLCASWTGSCQRHILSIALRVCHGCNRAVCLMSVAAVCSAAGMWQARGGSAERSCPAAAQAQEFAKVLVPLFKQIARCLNSSHFQARLPGRTPLRWWRLA